MRTRTNTAPQEQSYITQLPAFFSPFENYANLPAALGIRANNVLSLLMNIISRILLNSVIPNVFFFPPRASCLTVFLLFLEKYLALFYSGVKVAVK